MVKIHSSGLYSVQQLGPFPLATGETFKIGDFVYFNNGKLSNNVTLLNTKGILGIISGFVKSDGSLIGQGDVTQVVGGADYYAYVFPVYKEYLLEIDVSADLGTTANSDKPFVAFDLSSASVVDESTAVYYEDATSEMTILSLGPAIDSSTGLPSKRKILAKVLRTIF